jgi:hypothetical protein
MPWIIPAVVVVGILVSLFLPWVVRLIAASGFPTKDSIPPGKAQPIDGAWEGIVSNQRIRMVVDRGRAYARSSGRLILKDIEAVSEPSSISFPRKYRCWTVVARGGWFSSFTPATIEVLSENRLLIEVPPAPELSYNGGSETWYRVNPAASDAGAPEVGADTKVCPYCAETIKKAAILCRYCGKDLKDAGPAQGGGQPTSPHITPQAPSDGRPT